MVRAAILAGDEHAGDGRWPERGGDSAGGLEELFGEQAHANHRSATRLGEGWVNSSTNFSRSGRTARMSLSFRATQLTPLVCPWRASACAGPEPFTCLQGRSRIIIRPWLRTSTGLATASAAKC